MCNSLNSTLRATLAKLRVSDTGRIPNQRRSLARHVK